MSINNHLFSSHLQAQSLYANTNQPLTYGEICTKVEDIETQIKSGACYNGNQIQTELKTLQSNVVAYAKQFTGNQPEAILNLTSSIFDILTGKSSIQLNNQSAVVVLDLLTNATYFNPNVPPYQVPKSDPRPGIQYNLTKMLNTVRGGGQISDAEMNNLLADTNTLGGPYSYYGNLPMALQEDLMGNGPTGKDFTQSQQVALIQSLSLITANLDWNLPQN
ncbi:MAG: hypothetical protein SP1CHLAM54_05670 [Chlamydiia bacterium]|nr:hypothetical protein [Chlamydiia bacterium]MCH9615477.1 hypothetical protein [Chlamydiia bacterium]MCH9629132.1 hypothetical protein [Chlamydiia bacterium]